MTNEQVISALQLHDDQVAKYRDVLCPPIQAIRNQRAETKMGQLGHVRWMVQEAIGFVKSGRVDKAMCWLGFIQGVLWVLGVSSIEESKRANMPEGEEYKP